MFDPYHKWLAIPKDQRPPNYYQLLGISIGEDDADVIEEAALMRIAHVRNYQIGPHAAECAQLLRELGEASAVLGDPQRRRAYYESLRNTAAPVTAPHTAESPVDTASTVRPRFMPAETKAAPPRVPPPRRREEPLPLFERPTMSAGDPHQRTPAFEIPLQVPQRLPDEDPFEKLRRAEGASSTAVRDHEAAMRQLSAQAVRQLRKPADLRQDAWFVLLKNMVDEWRQQLPPAWRARAGRLAGVAAAVIVAWLLVKILR